MTVPAAVRLWQRLSAWLMAHPAGRSGEGAAADIQLSALRVVLLSSLVLGAVVGLHAGLAAWQRGKPWALVIVLVVVGLLGVAVQQARHNRRAGALSLLMAVYAAALGITVSTGGLPELARLGYVLIYASPLIAGLLLSWRLALGLMLLNTLGFALLLSGWQAPQLPQQAVRLPQAPAYVHATLFLFFNLCLPLAAFRVIAGMAATERRLRGWRALSEQVFQIASAPTVIADAEGQVLRANKPFLALCGAAAEAQLRGRPLAGLFVPPAGEADRAWRAETGRRWGLERPDGEAAGAGREVLLRSVRRIGRRLTAYGFEDVTELRQLQADLAASVQREAWATWHDPLTGLANRARCIQQLDARCARGATDLALLTLRLCNLRQLNARYGVPAGDALLRDFVASLQAVLPPGARLARVRGSVLALLLPGVADEAAALALVRRLRAKLPVQAVAARQTVRLELAFGLVLAADLLARQSDADGAELLRCGELALDMAQDPRWREDEGGLLLFNARTEQAVQRSMAIEAELPQALLGHQLHLLYQPKLAPDGVLLGFEALLRWHSPVLGVVPPAEFIPVAESCGLIGGITDRVLELACEQLAAWRGTLGYAGARVAVNLSAHDLERADFQPRLLATLARHGVEPAALELEVTESALARQPAQALSRLQCLHAAGFRIAIDDFGTGYSSLAKLVDLPIDVLKIDRSFLTGLPGDARRERVLRSMVSLALGLRLQVVAEGVETTAQQALLEALGVHGMQGWLHGRPQPALYWRDLLEARSLNALTA